MTGTVRTWAIAVAVSVIALALRVGHVIDTQHDPAFRRPRPGLDVQITWDAARAIRGDIEPKIEPMMLSAPLHVYWVAAHQALFGESIHRQRLIAAGWGALRILLTVLIVAALTRRLWAAATVGLVLAGLPSLIYFDTSLLKTSLDLILLTGLVAVVTLPRPPATHTAAVVRGTTCGVIVALAFLSQLGSFLFIVPVSAALALAPGWQPSQRRLAVTTAVAVFAAVFVAWQLRAGAASTTAAFVPRDGVDLRIGFGPHADGMYAPVPGLSGRLAGHVFEGRMLAELETGRPLGWSDANAVHRRAARSLAARNPVATLGLIARKLRLVINDHEVMSEDYLPALQARSTVLASTPVSFATLFVLGVLGLLEIARTRERHLVALLGGLSVCVAISCCLTFVTWRFRVPLVVPLAILAGPGLVRLGRVATAVASWLRRRAGAPRHVIAELAMVGIAAAASLVPTGVATRRFAASAANNALVCQQAEQVDAQLARSGDAIERALLLSRLERHTEAFAATRALVADGVRDPALLRAHLRYLIWLGDYDGASRFLAEVAPSAPGLTSPGQLRDRLLERVLARFVRAGSQQIADRGPAP